MREDRRNGEMWGLNVEQGRPMCSRTRLCNFPQLLYGSAGNLVSSALKLTLVDVVLILDEEHFRTKPCVILALGKWPVQLQQCSPVKPKAPCPYLVRYVQPGLRRFVFICQSL